MLLIVAADRREFAGLTGVIRRESTDIRWLGNASLPEGEAILVANGVGHEAATSAARRALERHEARAILSVGFAGGLDPDLQVGDIFVAEAIRHGPREYRGRVPAKCPQGFRRGSLLSVDAVVQSAEAKQELWQTGAGAVDMESAAVAQVAAEHGLPFFCIRSISDSATDTLPVDVNQALQADGSISGRALMGLAGLSVSRWFGLLRLGLQARRASVNLGEFLQQCEFAS